MKDSRIGTPTVQTSVNGPILYWMDREMRAHDNWALIRALALGHKNGQPVGVIYNLVAGYLGGGARQHAFTLAGLRELETTFSKYGIPFAVVLTDDTVEDIAQFIRAQKVGAVVTDMNPLRMNRKWKDGVAKRIDVPMEIVDAHNVVPVWVTSEKQEFGARTIRPKIHKHLAEYLDVFPRLTKQTSVWRGFPKSDWHALEKVKTDERAEPVTWLVPGEKAAKVMLKRFVASKLPGYSERRNDPNVEGVSDLSPYFHYGMLAPQRVALAVKESGAPLVDREAFIEEAVVRRELSDNYCYYNPEYDAVAGFPAWAQRTLDAHRANTREYTYTLRQFEAARTHDPVWNAAQNQMIRTGKMHGYMRMYWAKKILEWTPSPEDALRIAITLNDRYELDGRDPNGYVGCAWSIGGVHDRPWGERPIFGMIRYMNDKGCARKFDVKAYIAKWGDVS